MKIPVDEAVLEGNLEVPSRASGLVLFAHGSGSGRHSPRNRHVARHLQEQGLGTLLFDLLTEDEEVIDLRTRELRFNTGLLASRLVQATDWLAERRETFHLPIGYFGASTGAAAALVAAAHRRETVGAVVSRGGRPDLAGDDLARVTAPTLLIVGALDQTVISLNEEACERLRCRKDLRIVPGASHLFQEPGALDRVAQMAAGWFVEHLHAAAETMAATG